MTDKNNQMAERIARQMHIDETCIDPIWSVKVDIPLLEYSFACTMPKQPVILLPELRFKSLLSKLIECLSGSPGKLMIVDESNTRFESFRQMTPKSMLNLYFSTQPLSALNYASNSFHFTITEVGLSTLCRAEVVFSAYRRVLRPEGHLICAIPTDGSFPAFFDILEESLFRLHPQKCKEILPALHEAMSIDSISTAIQNSGLEITGCETSSFDLVFDTVEQLLFSTLVESHYLGYCLNPGDPEIDTKALLTHLVRSFHHYFQGKGLKVPMKIALFTTQKPK